MKQTILSLQAMRAVGAGIVVLHHALRYLESRGHIDPLTPSMEFGAAGVDIFFVISGFIMIYIAWDGFERPNAPRDFIIKRLIRIVPIYWFYLLAMCALLLAFPQYFSKGKTFDLANALGSFLFIPSANSIGEVLPVLPQGWSLNYEMYFYFVIALMLFLPRARFIGMLATLLVGSVCLGIIANPVSPVPVLVTSPLLLEFMMGCMLGYWYKKNARLSLFQAWTLICIGIWLFVTMAGMGELRLNRVLTSGVPAAFLIAGLVFLEKEGRFVVPNLIVKLGDSSYSLYLSHLFTVNFVGLVWTKYVASHYFLFVMAAMAASIVVAHVAFILIERPLTRSLNARYKKYAAEAGAGMEIMSPAARA